MLTVVYFLIATPLGLASRLLHDPLSRRRKRRAATYWTAPTAEPRDRPRSPGR
ncbi:hypothetical protein AB0D10_16755 [Kitasatospora sp. NPDC048545]|uniref:hypothetical protein n=1 Tax=unclassified Kitasatospora TaxID=2633591 RepID=UPI0034064DF7